jgi:hypothetical protein
MIARCFDLYDNKDPRLDHTQCGVLNVTRSQPYLTDTMHCAAGLQPFELVLPDDSLLGYLYRETTRNVCFESCIQTMSKPLDIVACFKAWWLVARYRGLSPVISGQHATLRHAAFSRVEAGSHL